jgi:hypothetical protein
MELLCTNCGATINPQDINVATNLAKCSTCNALLLANELKRQKVQVNITSSLVLPPNAKVQMRQDTNGTIILQAPASTYNVMSGWLTFLFAFIFALALSLVTFFSEMSWQDHLGSFVFTLIISIAFAVPALDLAVGHQKILFNENELTIEEKRFLRTKRIVFKKGDIDDITFTNLVSLGSVEPMFTSRIQDGLFAFRNSWQYKNCPAIIGNGKACFFFFELPLHEQEWVLSILKRVFLN